VGGATEKSEAFYQNLENYYIESMMHITTDEQHLNAQVTHRELFQVACKVKLECGRLM